MDKQLRKNIKTWGLEIREAVKKARREFKLTYTFADNMTGACAVASSFLKKKIEKECNIPVDFVYGSYWWDNHHAHHCWIEVQGHLIDITATQFGRKTEVAIFKPGKFPKQYKAILKNTKAMRQEIKFWYDQNPQNYNFSWAKTTKITKKKTQHVHPLRQAA